MRLAILLACVAAVVLGVRGFRAHAHRAYLDEQRGLVVGHTVALDSRQATLVHRWPNGHVHVEPLDDMMLLAVGTSPANKMVDGRDHMYWYVKRRVGAVVPYFAVSPGTMLEWMKPHMPGLDVDGARELLARFEREPDIDCVLWVSPRYGEVMGGSPQVGCRAPDER